LSWRCSRPSASDSLIGRLNAMREANLLGLFLVFAPISLISFGGGSAVLAEIQAGAVGNGWVSQKEFLDIYAIAKMAPGPGSLMVTLIGWKVAGWTGALVASAAIFIPSSLLVYSFVNIWARFRGAPWQLAVERGLAPIASGLITASALALIQHAEGGWLAWVLAAIATAIALFTNISPLLLMAGTLAAFMGASFLWF
jgi:chromate transporter